MGAMKEAWNKKDANVSIPVKPNRTVSASEGYPEKCLAMVAITFSITTGSIGFISCLWFVRHIYSAIKVD